MSKEDILQILDDLPPISEFEPFDTDDIYDFALEHMGDDGSFQFHDIKNILQWLHAEDSHYDPDACTHPAELKQLTEPDDIKFVDKWLTEVLKPGTKITIKKPSPTDIKFNDIESVQAYLKQVPAYPPNDETEDVDVTTYDSLPLWSHSAAVETKPSRDSLKSHGVLTEKQPKATVKYVAKISTFPDDAKFAAKRKARVKVQDNDDVYYECLACDKKYKYKTSLNRHELDKHVPKDASQPAENKQATKRAPRNHKKKSTLPVNSNERIQT